jgi:hypothetical protein
MPVINPRRTGALASFFIVLSPLSARADLPRDLSHGADVILEDVGSTAVRWGTANGITAYSIGSRVCNVGDVPLEWGIAFGRTPVFGSQVYRLHDGVIEMIGMSWVKGAMNAAPVPGCGSFDCMPAELGMLGPGCKDIYTAGFNGMQSTLGPRSAVNPITGQLTGFNPPAGAPADLLAGRLQVRDADRSPATYPTALYFVEGVYIGTDDAADGNAANNASYKQAVFLPSGDMNHPGITFIDRPAIYAWRDHGGGLNVEDPDVTIVPIDVPGEGRFYAGWKVRRVGPQWRYDYAIFNLNSDRAAGAFSIPLRTGVTVSSLGFHDVNYHSGEPYDGSDWIASTTGGNIRWRSPATYAQNPNTNALRWGTMYNFRFLSNRPPATATARIELFKPGTPSTVEFTAVAPAMAEPIPGDLNCDGNISQADIAAFVFALTEPSRYEQLYPSCDRWLADVNDDGQISVGDIAHFVALLATF